MANKRLFKDGELVQVVIGKKAAETTARSVAKYNGRYLFIKKMRTIEDFGTEYELEDEHGKVIAPPSGIPYLFVGDWLEKVHL